MLDTDTFEKTRNCNHSDISAPRRRVAINGIVHFRRQCLNCGASIGNAIKMEVANTISLQENNCWPLPFDEALYEKRLNIISGYYERKRKELEQEKTDRQIYWEDRKIWYREVYLLSEEWKIKRQKVINRCNNICEGCGEKKVTQVHHITYDHIGNELLFELVGLCDDCHSIAHDGEIEC